MRTTLTLEQDVADQLKELAHRQRKPFKVVVNEVIRAGMNPAAAEQRTRFEVRPHRCGFKPGVDLRRLNQLSDQLQSDSFAAESGSGS